MFYNLPHRIIEAVFLDERKSEKFALCSLVTLATRNCQDGLLFIKDKDGSQNKAPVILIKRRTSTTCPGF